jgi:hypothetical protein
LRTCASEDTCDIRGVCCCCRYHVDRLGHVVQTFSEERNI